MFREAKFLPGALGGAVLAAVAVASQGACTPAVCKSAAFQPACASDADCVILRGVVRDNSSDHVPIAGVVIRGHWVKEHSFDGLSDLGSTLSGDTFVLASTQTDAAGRYEFRMPLSQFGNAATGNVTLEAEHADYFDTDADVPVAGQHLAQDLQLRRQGYFDMYVHLAFVPPGVTGQAAPRDGDGPFSLSFSQESDRNGTHYSDNIGDMDIIEAGALGHGVSYANGEFRAVIPVEADTPIWITPSSFSYNQKPYGPFTVGFRVHRAIALDIHNSP